MVKIGVHCTFTEVIAKLKPGFCFFGPPGMCLIAATSTCVHRSPVTEAMFCYADDFV